MSRHGPERKRTCQGTAIPIEKERNGRAPVALAGHPLLGSATRVPQPASQLLRVAFPGRPTIPCPAWAVQRQMGMAAHGSAGAVRNVCQRVPLVACPAVAGGTLPMALEHNSVVE